MQLKVSKEKACGNLCVTLTTWKNKLLRKRNAKKDVGRENSFMPGAKSVLSKSIALGN